MKEIILTQSQIALVDDEDYEMLNQFKWCANKHRNTFYAVRSLNPGTILMHRMIECETDPNIQIDHIDGNGCNNQRENLRVCTNQQNGMNRQKQKGCSSQFKGVYWDGQNKKWRAYIGINNKMKSLGVFDSELAAAMTYNITAIDLFGEFAKLNKI